jgi:F-type H+-transporting ATPase subunit gamma
LIRQYLFAVLYRALAESLASENAARLASMQAAEKNIEERSDELTARYHRRRQNAITEELLDVTAGFEVLQDQ